MIERNLIVGAAIVLFGAASFAQQPLSREDVQSELAQAQASGALATRGEAWDGSFEPARSGVYGRPFAAEAAMSREAVIAETVRARQAGEMASGEAWDGTFQPASGAASGVAGRAFSEPGISREAVQNELARAAASGELASRQYDYVGGN